MRRAHVRKRSAGFTLLEFLFTSSIVMIIVSALISAVVYVTKQTTRARVMVAQDRQVQAIMGNLRANLRLYAPISTPSTASSSAQTVKDKLANLPMAFSDSVLVPVEQCTECPGRLGFVIQPLDESMPDLYMVTLRIMNKIWYGDKGFRDYRFIASYQ